MRTNVMRVARDRSLVQTAGGFGIDTPANWIDYGEPNAEYAAISVGARSECDMFIVEAEGYTGQNALVCAVGCPLVGPFRGPLRFRPYHTIASTAAFSYGMEAYVWHRLPRTFATKRADKVYGSPVMPFLGGAQATRNVIIYTFGRRQARLVVRNNTAGPLTVDVTAGWIFQPNAVEPGNVRASIPGGDSAFQMLTNTYYSTGAIAAGANFADDIPLIGGPHLLAVTESAGVGDADLYAMLTLQD